METDTQDLLLNKVFNEDCLKTLSRMPDNFIDLIITSPPYNVWRNRRTQAKKEEYWKRTNILYDNYSDKMSDEDYQLWQIKVINECLRVLKKTGTICYNHKDQIFNYSVTSPLSFILKSNAVYRQRITWNRGGMQAFNNVRFYRCEEDIYILGKEAKGFKWNSSASKYMSIWNIPPRKKGEHPAAFPEEIPRRCIEAFSNVGDIVYDPFMGSGTVGKVAKKNNRNWIGSEISEKYTKLIEKAIEE